MTYKETVDYLYSQLPAFQKIGDKAYKPKLDNIIALCELLGNPQDNFKSIHVAGTNGKGSSSHFLTSILMEAGYKVGLYTSPHLKDYRERFRINGELIPENCVIDFVRDYANEFSILKPSFFEVSVVLAFKYFSDENVDIAVIEVGLGGRLDSTNIISKKLVSLVTNIGFDHTDILGDTLEKIAFEKAGIIKPHVPVVISEYTDETKPVFTEIAALNCAPISFAQDEYEVLISEETIESLKVSVKSKKSGKVYDIASGLVGKYQIYNILGVLNTIERIGSEYRISDESIYKGFERVISNTGLKGRWQVLARDPLMICDTGHNEHAFKITIRRLQNAGFERVYYILGFVKDKDKSEILNLIPENSVVYLCEFDSFRAMTVTDLERLEFKFAKNISIFNNVNLAIEKARREAKQDDLIFIGGSTYLVAEIDNL